MPQKRKRVRGPDKVKALKRHLLEKVPVSQLCDELGIASNVFYSWQTNLFDNAEQVLSVSLQSKPVTTDQRRIELFEQSLRQRGEALAELMDQREQLSRKDHQTDVGPIGACEVTGECFSGLQGDELQPGHILPLQGVTP